MPSGRWAAPRCWSSTPIQAATSWWSGLSRHGGQPRMKGEPMSKRDTVDYRLDSELTPEQVDELRRLEAMSDADIDTTAIPPATAEAWRHARRGPVTQAELAAMRPFFRPVKEPVSIRLDADVLRWFKQHGRGWQTAINRALRAHIERNG